MAIGGTWSGRTHATLKKVTALGVAGGTGLALVAAFTPTAHASAPLAAVPTGMSASTLPGGTVFGPTPPDTPETVTFVLRIRGRASLENAVERGITRDLSVSQFARRYGQSSRSVRELTGYLGRFGITTSVYKNRINVVAHGTAGQFDKALSVRQHQYRVPAQKGTHGMPGVRAQIVHATRQQPLLPRRIARTVEAILGLSNYAPFTSHAVHTPTHLQAKTTGTDSCVALTGLPRACNLPQDFARRYGVDPLYRSGHTGAGQTVGIVTLAALDVGGPAYFWKNVAHIHRTGQVSVQNIDGGPGAPSDAAGSGETDLDVEQSGGVAPGADVVVYQAPNTDGGWADAFFTAATQNTAGSVSSSWGESETVVQAAIASGVETPHLQAAYDEAFLELAAQGQATFLSSGDEGAYTAREDLTTTNLSVDTPADSPYVTAAGGTTLPWSETVSGVPVKVTSQRTWGWDYLWPYFATSENKSLTVAAEAETVGSGGGFSVFERTPSYQKGVAGTNRYSALPYLTPTDFQNVQGITAPTAWTFNPTPTVISGTASGRAMPDVSTDADPFTGYLLYEPSSTGAALQGGWGGTSFVAPQLNGSTAVIDQALHRRAGLWNPMMYRLARGSASPFTPINTRGTGSDNIYYTGTPGTVYNPGSGLGTPNLSQFASELRLSRR